MIERLGVSSNEKRFLPSKPFLPFSSKFYNTNYTIYTILRFATEEETQLHCSRSIDNFLEISFLRHRDEVVVYLATRGLPSVVCNYRSCEGVTHQEQTVYTVGCLSIPVVTITSTARRAFVWATRHEIGGGEMRSVKPESTVASKPNVCSMRLSRDYTRLEELRRREESRENVCSVDFSQIFDISSADEFTRSST